MIVVSDKLFFDLLSEIMHRITIMLNFIVFERNLTLKINQDFDTENTVFQINFK